MNGQNPILNNLPFEAIRIGQSASLTRTAGRDDIDLFAALSGDINPAHTDANFAAHDPFGHIIVHGMWTAALISAALGTRLPGPGTIYLDQDLQFRHPVAPGDTITATVTVKEKRQEKRIVLLDTRCLNQLGQTVLLGTATVIAPAEPMQWQPLPPPDISIRRRDHYRRFIAQAKASRAPRTAVVYPCSAHAIGAAAQARDEGLLDPILIGPQTRIRLAAEQADVDLAGMAIEAVQDAPGAACARALELAAAGRAACLMTDSLHSKVLLAAIAAPGSGLRGDRHLSHAYVMDAPAHARPLVVTDALINIRPDVDRKRDICQNAIDLLSALGVEKPRVAVLAAVETVDAGMPSTLDAAALTTMAARGQITGGIVDGPLAFDHAMGIAAHDKGISAPDAERADVLLAPDLDAASLLARQQMYFAGADAAGLVLGARLPILLAGRSDSLQARLASAALAQLLIRHSDRQPKPA